MAKQENKEFDSFNNLNNQHFKIFKKYIKIKKDILSKAHKFEHNFYKKGT